MAKARDSMNALALGTPSLGSEWQCLTEDDDKSIFRQA